MPTIKKAGIDFATATVEELTQHLLKLKKDEARLEIALTLRDFPQTEDCLVRLTTCVVELDVAERAMRMEASQTSAAEIQSKKDGIQSQIVGMEAKLVMLPDNEAGRKLRDFYTSCIAKLKTEIHTVGLSKKNVKFLEHFEATLRTLRRLFKQVTNQNFPENFQIFDHIPGLARYLEVADSLVAQKGE